MMQNKVIVVMLALVFCQQVQADKVWTWAELKNLASERNPTLKSAASKVDSANADLKSTYGGFAPSLAVTATKVGATIRAETERGDLETNENNEGISLGASLNVFKGFATVGAMEKAAAEKSRVSANLRRQSSIVRKDLRIGFFNLYVQQERLKLFERVLMRQKRNLKLVGIKYENGTEARWNLQKAQSDYDLAQFNLDSAKSGVELAQENLRRLVDDDSLEVSAVEAPDESILRTPLMTNEELTQVNPSLEMLKFERLKLEKEKTIAKSAFMPSVDLGYAKSVDRVENSFRDNAFSDTWKVKVTWNLFSGLTDTYTVQKASAAQRAVEHELHATRNSLLTDFKNKAEEIRLSAEKIGLSRKAREVAEERLKIVGVQYRTGMKSYLDWEQATVLLLEAEQSEIQVKKDAYDAFAEFEQLVGKTLGEP